jgi:ABC-type spermidine/putrescine transport system permease subunit I
MNSARVLKSCALLLAVIIFGMALIVLAFFLTSSDKDIFAFANALKEHGLPASLLHSLGICFAGSFIALLVGFPLGTGIAKMRRRWQQWALVILILFAFLPAALTVSWNAAEFDWPTDSGLVIAAISWVALAGVLAAKSISNSATAAAGLSGLSRLTILARVHIPRLLPVCVAALFGSFILLLFLEGTIFSAAICIFEQSAQQGRILPSILTILFLALPLFSILVYLFGYLWYTRPKAD